MPGDVRVGRGRKEATFGGDGSTHSLDGFRVYINVRTNQTGHFKYLLFVVCL